MDQQRGHWGYHLRIPCRRHLPYPGQSQPDITTAHFRRRDPGRALRGIDIRDAPAMMPPAAGHPSREPAEEQPRGPSIMLRNKWVLAAILAAAAVFMYVAIIVRMS